MTDALHDPASLGYAYGAVTEHLGWRRGDEEGTVMALAALGDPARFRQVFSEAIALTPTGFTVDPGLFALRVLRHGWPRVTPTFTRATCPPRAADDDVTQTHADLAAALQERTEQVMLHLARRARHRTGARLLCLGGGVATNCVAVGKIVDAGLFEQVSVPPAPGDAGTAVGAALAAHLDATGSRVDEVAHRCYLGPAYPGDAPPPAEGQNVRRVADPSSTVADSLAAGRLVGVFRGRMEAGPRALGNRSILASPLVPGVVDRLNATVKFREPFRPFAPVVLAEAAPHYFRIRQPSPYMSIAVEVTELARQRIPACTGVSEGNGSGRPHARRRMVGDQVKIGYSCWGFLGPGIPDTPDGGRSHRRALVDGIAAAGHDILFLQENRDLHEAGLDLRDHYQWHSGFPPVDALFLEWRWPIPGRNTTQRGTPGHTPDLHRQNELLAHYTLKLGVPTVIWDKDRQLAREDPLRHRADVAICEPALRASPGATSLLFPVADTSLDTADPAALAAVPRSLPLVYVGNQYDRDEAFHTFFAPAAARFRHGVAGKWTRTAAWPHVNFTGRCAFTDVETLHRSALATILLLPERYERAGHMTQRLFEAVLAGCLPITPARIRGAGHFVPSELHAEDGDRVIERLHELLALAGTPAHVDLLEACVQRLDPFRLSRQIETLTAVLVALVDRPRCAGMRRSR